MFHKLLQAKLYYKNTFMKRSRKSCFKSKHHMGVDPGDECS